MLRRAGSAALVLMLGAACSSATTRSAVSLSPEDFVDVGVDMFGVVVDIPHRKSLGASDDGLSYSWQAEHTLLERGERTVWISAEILQIAGLPVFDQGTRLDFTGGMYRRTRFRLAGTVDFIWIADHYEARLRTQWRLYDTEASDFVFEGRSDGFARGQNLGRTGIQPNAMLDAFEDCLGNLMAQEEFQAAIGVGAPSEPVDEGGDG